MTSALRLRPAALANLQITTPFFPPLVISDSVPEDTWIPLGSWGGIMLRRLLLAVLLVPALGAPPAGAGPYETTIVSATGPLSVLNGIAAIDLQVAILPLGIPAPSGQLTFVAQSTFDPPGPVVATVAIDCARRELFDLDRTLYASGDDARGDRWGIRLHVPPLGPATFAWSRQPGEGPCGAPALGGVPMLGPVVFLP